MQQGVLQGLGGHAGAAGRTQLPQASQEIQSVASSLPPPQMPHTSPCTSSGCACSGRWVPSAIRPASNNARAEAP